MTWEDAPSHICRGGDVRGLAFCCPPVKPCPVLNALQEVNLTPQEFVDIKVQFGKETRLGEGAGTCFGSLVWCCKPSKPCPLRDMTLNQIGLSVDEYLTLKKQLSERILAAAQKSTVEPNREAILALSATFDISEENAAQVLADCNNDLRLAVKTIKMNELEGQ
jgi:putative methanogenesis marker domain 9